MAPSQEFQARMYVTVRVGLEAGREMLGDKGTETVQTNASTSDNPTTFDSFKMGDQEL